MKEIEFFNIPNYEGFYKISRCGIVKSLKQSKETILNGCIDKCGYKQFSLYGKRGMFNFKLSQLLAMTFMGHKVDGHKIVVDHINNDKTDNRLSNLQLISQRENTTKDRKGTSAYIGVSWSETRNKWISQITINGKHKYLGAFVDELEASKAYQKKLKSLKQQL